ncbi:uncharacterized protein C2845_PM07G40530 [Panicum miliaceum]|uniref:Uncharacterized protein n=1 Tax=Panicum miliaceum TaxID=4540 RepID=A0A3L6SKV0_PANMI|nr:uncharacterized protein C2845_PM07G40530 [Panicum miliaceum]
MVMDEPLDFEEGGGSPLPRSAPCQEVLRKKVIGLDDLLLDYFETGKGLRKVKAAKTKHGPMGHDSDEEDKKVREDEICKIFEDCEEKAKGLDARDDVPPWDQLLFGCQKAPSNLSDMGVDNCQLLQSFCASEHLGFDLEIKQGEERLEGVLMDGWLLKVVRIGGSVEDSIASWTLTKRKDLSDDKLLVNLGYFPSYSVLKCAILSYGVSMDPNCLRIVHFITGTNKRRKFLRSQLALQLLKINFGLKVGNVEKILKLVTSINVKEKECDFFRLYVYLVLMDSLLFSSDAWLLDNSLAENFPAFYSHSTNDDLTVQAAIRTGLR